MFVVLALDGFFCLETKMTPKRYRKILDEIGMSQVGAGRFLEIDPRQSRRFASGDRPVPAAIAMLLELMVSYNLAPSVVRRLADLEPLEGLNRARGRPRPAQSDLSTP